MDYILCRDMNRALLLCALLLGGVATAFAKGAPAPVEIRVWHALGSAQAAELEALTARFNASHPAYRVALTRKGAYAETLAALRAADKADAPHLVQFDEARTAELLAQKKLVRPLWQVLAQWKKALREKTVPGVAAAYSDMRGRLLAMPLNASTPVLYYNRDAFRRAQIEPAAPKTWYEMPKTLGALIDAGQACGLTTAFPSWVLLENMSAWHDEPFATRHNGMDGDDARLNFNGKLMVRWIAMLASWEKSGYFTYAGRDAAAAEARFTDGECALLTSSSASYGAIAERAGFDLGVAPLPYYDDFSAAPQNTLVRGGGLWVVEGRANADYRGVAHFVAFLYSPEVQAEWHQKTGSAPLVQAAYEIARAQGFYEKHPGYEIAVRQLMVKAPTKTSRGIRLGGLPGIRDIIHEELESVWGGKKTPIDALNAAVLRGNEQLLRTRSLQQ
ncbi:MAG: sn-glycerol-3-phosphate ABC transporter substrate-binding protein UgpB [Betaproteobacteria bacterium]